MTLRPIKLRFGGDEVYLVSSRDTERWGGFLNGRGAAYRLVTPENVTAIRAALMIPPNQDTEAVFVELTKQLEDGSATFFEIPPQPVSWDAPQEIDIFDLVPKKGDEDGGGDRPTPHGGLHWIEVVCLSVEGGSYAGAKAHVRLPGGRSEFVTLDGRSAVRFDDLAEGGTVHFELSADAVARGEGVPAVGQRYDLGGPTGLVVGRQHTLVVHPDPSAFVSVELFCDDEPVMQGQYTLTTKLGDDAGALLGTVVRVEGFSLPSGATYGFEAVILPPRPANASDDPRPVRPHGPDVPRPTPGPVPPVGPDKPDKPDKPDTPTLLGDRLRLSLQGGENLAVQVRFEGGLLEATTDADGLLDLELPEGVRDAELLMPSRAEVYVLELQPLDPASSPRGAATRLRNLGLYAAPVTDTFGPALGEALRRFQRMRGLPVTAELDAQTADALRGAHGS